MFGDDKKKDGHVRIRKLIQELGAKQVVKTLGNELSENPDTREAGNKVKAVADTMRGFLLNESGATAAEYAVMLALIVVVCLAAITTLGKNARGTFTDVGSTIGTTVGS